MFNKNYLMLLVSSLFLFPSCIKYYKLANTEFHQGQAHNDNRKALEDAKKKVAVYNEFETKAIFDVLYLSDSVKVAYVDKCTQKKGLDLNAKNSLLTKELEQNKFWTTFYVLADLRDRRKTSLNDKNSPWSFYLLLKNSVTLQPITIKEIDVEPEYQYLFGSRFTMFQRYYEIKFPAKDVNNNLYINNNEPFELVISGAHKETHVKFNDPMQASAANKYNVNSKGKILSDEDFYWL